MMTTQGLQSLSQSDYTPYTLQRILKSVVESAPRREGVQLKEQPEADSIHRVCPIAFQSIQMDPMLSMLLGGDLQ
jgi:hypothetical protein